MSVFSLKFYKFFKKYSFLNFFLLKIVFMRFSKCFFTKIEFELLDFFEFYSNFR